MSYYAEGTRARCLLVIIQDGVKSVCDSDNCAVIEFSSDSLLNQIISFQIHSS